MSIKIRIEVRDDEGIFGTKRLAKEELAALLVFALQDDGLRNIAGPFVDGVVQAFALDVDDPRERWRTEWPASQRREPSTDEGSQGSEK